MNGGVPASTAPIPVAIVGAGIIGANHAAAIIRHPRLRIVALVDAAPEASQELALHIASATGDEPPARYETLTLADHPIELVAICTPTGLHADQAEEALAAGKHIVIEKPLDVSFSRARWVADLAAAAEARGVVASVISQHRFDPASVAVAKAIAAGRLGRITSAVASVAWWRAQSYYDSATWRGTWALDGGGALMNQGIHTVDLLVWLLGRPVEVFAHTARLAHERIDVEDVAVATIRFASGALAVLHATTAAYPGTAVRLQVHGSRGSAVIHDDQLEYFHAATDDDDEPRAPANQASELVAPEEIRGAPKPDDSFLIGHLRQYHDVVEAIEKRRPASIRVQDGLVALAVVTAVYLSATLSRPVALDDIWRGEFDDVAMATRPTQEPGEQL
jgi:UDP-N-acetyl-2-amino-2-deoxyglucuronate dehydrogenase